MESRDTDGDASPKHRRQDRLDSNTARMALRRDRATVESNATLNQRSWGTSCELCYFCRCYYWLAVVAQNPSSYVTRRRARLSNAKPIHGRRGNGIKPPIMKIARRSTNAPVSSDWNSLLNSLRGHGWPRAFAYPVDRPKRNRRFLKKWNHVIPMAPQTQSIAAVIRKKIEPGRVFIDVANR